MDKSQPKTNAERQEALKKKRKDAGLTRLEIYAPPDDHAKIKAYAATLSKTKPAEAG